MRSHVSLGMGCKSSFLCSYSKNLHLRSCNFKLSLFLFLCDEVIPAIWVLVLNTGSKKIPGKMIVDNLALKDYDNIVSHPKVCR